MLWASSCSSSAWCWLCVTMYASSATVSRVNRMLNYGTGSVAASVKHDLEQQSHEEEK